MVTKEEAELHKWIGTIERTPSYYRTKPDLKQNGVPEELWEELAKHCEPVKEALGLEKKEIQELNNFILDAKKLPQIIDHALGKIKIGEDYFRYFGVYLYEYVQREVRKGKTTETITRRIKSPCLILEDGRVLSLDTKPDYLNYEFESLMTLKENRWSLSSINNYIKGNFKPEDYTFSKVFESYRGHYNKAMVFSDTNWYDLNALWDMVTYYQDLIDKFLIIKHEGISGTAKSKGMKISSNLSFNGKKFLCPTPANFFRYRHNNKAVLYIEEAEKLFDTSKNKNVGDSDLVEYLNGSYEKGNTVPRQNDKDRNQTDEFDPAGFTRIGAINPLKGALEKRSIPLHMIKASSSDERGNVEIPTEKGKEFVRSRDLSYICSLINYKIFEKKLNSVENNYNLHNRQWLVARPIIAMASCISDELEKRVGNYLSRLFEIRDDNYDEDSWERILARKLVILCCKQGKEDFYSVEEIKKILAPSVEHGKYNLSNTKTGMLMIELGFSDFKANPTGNQRGYRLPFLKLCEILIRQEWLSYENILEEVKRVSKVSGCQFNEDIMCKWYTDTFLTPDTIIKNNNEFSDTLTDRTPVLGRGEVQND